MLQVVPAFGALLLLCGLLAFWVRQWEQQSAGTEPPTIDRNESERLDPEGQRSSSPSSRSVALKPQFRQYRTFRNNYLCVYLLMMLADWLQGSYVYALYKDYGYDLDQIGGLFVVGFLSSALFGTFISSYADSYGRKKLCITFSIFYTLSCFTKLSSNYQILIFGRLLGGISTSLLFSVFETWMVSEHNSQGFSSDLLSDTFSWSTFGNSVVAILSGMIANTLVDWTGSFVSPFMASAIFLVIGGVLVYFTWSENYGERNTSANQETGVINSLKKGLHSVRTNVSILSVGSIVSLFESSMYTFVFLWGPVLEQEEPKESHLPYGWIFACFMVCIMIGSILFRFALAKGFTVERLVPYILGVATLSFMIPIATASQLCNFWAFNVFEICCGIYFPAMGTLKARYVPEETRATVMNIFRFPLNIIVVVLLTRVSQWSNAVLFGVCATSLSFAVGFSLILVRLSSSNPGSLKSSNSFTPGAH